MRLLLLSLAACSATTATPSVLDPAPPPEPVELDPRYVATIRAAATGYTAWGRVDARPNIAPMLCRLPMRGDYGMRAQIRRSDADESPHGEKLYYLWASDKWAYLGLARADAALPVGFAIVKEAFIAEHGGPPPPPPAPEPDLPVMPAAEPAPITTMLVDGARLTVGAPHGVYVMAKVGAGDGTDEGWIYGTVTPDGTVTSAGTVARCIGCHEGAPHERLFGLQPAKGVTSGEIPPPQGHPIIE